MSAVNHSVRELEVGQYEGWKLILWYSWQRDVCHDSAPPSLVHYTVLCYLSLFTGSLRTLGVQFPV